MSFFPKLQGTKCTPLPADQLTDLLGNTDIYLIDQLLKGRYHPGERILDAGCGHGRNMHWFVRSAMTIYGIDQDSDVIDGLRSVYPDLPADQLQVSAVASMPFPDNHFDHVISSAVLHFAEGPEAFRNMWTEMIRVLKPGGSLFVRMASDIGIEDRVVAIGPGVYLIPDGSTRFLLTRPLLQSLLDELPLEYLEPFKTVNVDNQRVMCTLVLQKKLSA